MNLKISVIIPCYQVEEYVAYVYADLCKQSFTDMEMIFVNDGGGKSCIHRGCKFFHVGKVSIGKNTVINFGCYLDNRRGITIGNNVGIAHNTKIYTLGHDFDDQQFKTKGAAVTINDHVFIFSNAITMPGVTIGEGAIVLAGSVVTKDIEPWMIVGGNPARKIRERRRDINYKQVYRYWFAL